MKKPYFIDTSASKIIGKQKFSECRIKPEEVGIVQNFHTGINSLDGVDPWHDHLQTNLSKYLTAEELAQFKEDVALGTLPIVKNFKTSGLRTNILDVDTNAYYVARNEDGTIKKKPNGDPIYIWHKDGTEVDFSKVGFKKESFLYFFTRNQKKMMVAPSRYNGIKRFFKDYMGFLISSKYIQIGKIYDKQKDGTQKLREEIYHGELSKKGYQALQDSIDRFFNDIESGNWSNGWRNKIYDLVGGDAGNHWMLMSYTMERNFSRMLSDQDYANSMLGNPISKQKDFDFRKFAEAASSFANKATGGNLTVLDFMGGKWLDLYGMDTIKIFGEDPNGNIYRMNQDLPEEVIRSKLTKSYLYKLSPEQQIEQIKYTINHNNLIDYDFTGELENSKFFTKDVKTAYIRAKSWYNGWGNLLRIIQKIGKPGLFATLMSLGKGLGGLMPLLILNSCMFATDKLVTKNKLDGNRGSFLSKWELNNVMDRDNGLGSTLLDTSLKAYKGICDALQQGLFNVGDMFMQNSYKARQYQTFFESYFPGIKTLEELDNHLNRMMQMEKLGELEPGTCKTLLQDARNYVDHSVRLATTGSNVMANNVMVHTAKQQFNQPMLDTFFALWHFFSGWGYSKIRGAFDIVSKGTDNILSGKIGAKYYDDLLSTNPARAEELMRKAYLENEGLIYLLNKIYTAAMISKYLYRNSGDHNEDTFFDSLSDLTNYFSLFCGDWAAFESIPEGRVIKHFMETFFGVMEDGGLGGGIVGGVSSGFKEAVRSMFRKLFPVQIGIEYATLTYRDWDVEESTWLKLLSKSIQDNCNGYLFYLKDATENGEFNYYIPRGPNSFINNILGIQNKNVKFVNDQKSFQTYANLFNSSDNFTNWLLYSFPFVRQVYGSLIPDTQGFLDKYNGFRGTDAYIKFTNNEFPLDMNDRDWVHIYNTITGRLASNEGDIRRSDLYTFYDFVGDDGTIGYNKQRQIQERIIHTFLKNGLSKERAEAFMDVMNYYDSKYMDEAMRTLAYIEEQTPGEGLQVLAYVMSNERVKATYYNKPKDRTEEQIKAEQEKNKIAIAKKYANFVPFVDKHYSWTQIILHYAKTHDTAIADYISDAGSDNKIMKLISPSTGEDFRNIQLTQNFQAQLMVDIEGASGNPDARKLMNGFAMVFQKQSYQNKDGSLQPEYAAYALNQIETVYDHIDSLAMDENDKRILKQGALMFGDTLIPYIVEDKTLTAREDVQIALKDWTTYWYKEFKELDGIACEYIEDQIANAEYKKNGRKKKSYNGYGSYDGILKGGYSKKSSGFNSRYNYMKNKAYSPNYIKYRVYNWIPKEYNRDYLKENEYILANQRAGKYYGMNAPQLKKGSGGSGGQQKDDSIGFSAKRGKAIQFYKREDIDKPVEYKTPRRKRWVKKGKGLDPISPTTWKHLTPNPK